jgi:hypothetical protein
MARPRKTLLERVLERSFRPKRYHELLAERLPAKCPLEGRREAKVWRSLRDVQAYYRKTKDDEARLFAAESFSEFVRTLHGGPWPSWSREPRGG